MNQQINITFFVDGYPTETDPSFAFVRPLVLKLADRGFCCSVIAPNSITDQILRRKDRKPYKSIDMSPAGHAINIVRPKYVSVSKCKIKDIPLSALLQRRACIKAFKHLAPQDVVYGHFWKMASNASAAAKGTLPVIAASGESSIEANLSFATHSVVETLQGSLAGTIYVSNKNMEESKRLGLTTVTDDYLIAPNGFDSTSFYPMDKKSTRMKMGFEDKFTVIFVGAFNNRKGVLRVSEALKKAKGVNAIFIGSGDQQPDCNNVVFSGRVPHNKLVDYLNCADCFVLPTLAEGCCNAIVEALACGLPIISSNRPFNDDILDEECSIRINPESINEIEEAITLLKSDEELLGRMSEAALRKASELSLEKRADRIADFIRKTIGRD